MTSTAPSFTNIVLIILLIATMAINFTQCNNNKVANYNISALTDSLRESKNKNGEIVASKKSLLMDLDQLEKTNSELNEEVNKLSKKDKRNLLEIGKLQVTIDMLTDSILRITKGEVIVVNDTVNQYSYKFAKSDKYRELTGVIKIKSTTEPLNIESVITADKVITDITIGKKKVKDGVEVFVTSSNPYLKVNKLENSIINYSEMDQFKKERRFIFGPQLGIGVTGKVYFGLGVTYRIFGL